MTQPISPALIAGLTARLETLADPADPAALLALLRTLYAVGRQDLPLGRLFEGHVDALQIVSRYGSAGQGAATHAAARTGATFGVWNADRGDDPLRLEDGRLHGGKAFASGAGILSHALVTVDAPGGRQLLLIDLAATPPEVDRGWWHVTGMQRSETHRVRWNGAALPADARIGAPGDYVREPWFSGGALRFAAVQAGGIAGLADQTRTHLVAHGRAGDPDQRGRLANLYLTAQAAADTVAAAARRGSAERPEETLALVSAARVAVYQAGEQALTLAQAAIGLQAMFVAHPIAALLNDLTVYLRQPGPDAQRARVGDAVAAGVLVADLR